MDEYGKAYVSAFGSIFGIVVFIIIFIIIPLLMGNCWFSKTSVKSDIKFEYPQVKKIIINRNIFDYSKVKFRNKNEVISQCIDSDILFDYYIIDCD